LFYKLGNFNNSYTNKFEGLINSIIEEFNKDQVIYNSLNFKLNKELCLIIDETQDLSDDYGKAIINIIKNSYIDAYIVGDKLQSISFEKNAFLYLIENDFSDLYINKIKYENTNICRRFTNKSLINFINKKIPFDEYKLLPIIPYKNDNSSTNNLCIFNRIPIINLTQKENKNGINEEINEIMNYYTDEVNINKRNPEDFLIITPFTTKNWFCEALERSIQLFWCNKFTEKKYKRFIVFHKSETGTCIDLNESLDKTRIVSIHTSKGDGRKVVFIIGLTTGGLLKFSNGQYNIVYNSLIHVALTRQKEKLYIRLENNNDDIYNLFSNEITYNNIIPKISCFIYLDIKNLNNNSLNTNIICNSEYNDISKILNNDKNNKIIDMSHHNIRYTCIYTYFITIAMKYDNKYQIKQILDDIISSKIKICNDWKEYNICLYDNKRINECYKSEEEIRNKIENKIRNKTIPIFNINKKYLNIILENIKNIKLKLQNKNYYKLCPIERILLLYMTDICNIPFNCRITITEIYNIIDNFYNVFNYDLSGHNRCLCKKYFKNNEIENKNDVNYKYLLNFYDDMININKMYINFFKKYNNLHFLLNHYIGIKFDSDLILIKQLQTIAYNDEYVFNIYFKPNLCELNYYEVLNESIIDTFLIKYCNGDYNNDNVKENNKIRFHNKKIKTIVFSLNLDKEFEIEWTEIDLKKGFIIDLIKEFLLNDLKMKTNGLYSIYNYYERTNNLNKLKNDFIEKNKNLPDFIKTFFEIIEDESDENGKLSKEKFNELLTKRIKKIINKSYLI